MSDTAENNGWRTVAEMARFNLEPIAQEHIRSRLHPLVILTETMDRLLDRTIEVCVEHPRPGAAAKVGLILTTRLANDLRVCALTSHLGYGLQALALAGSVIEVVGSLSYVSGSDDRAITWAEHTDLGHTYPRSVRDGIKATLAALNISDPLAEENWYAAYRDMCMAKHANPRLSLIHGLRVDSCGAFHVCGPDCSDLGTSSSARALWYAATFGAAGILVAIGHCSHDELRAQVRSEALRLNDRRHGLTSWYLAVAGPGSSPEKEAAALSAEADRIQREAAQLRFETARLRRETSRVEEHIRRHSQ